MVHNLFDLTGKKALVTGANSGLGLGYARGLAKHGADLVIWGRNEAKNKKAVEELKKHGGRVVAHAVDVANEAEVVDGIKAAVSEMGRLDTVIANAGFASVAPSVLELTSKMYHDLLNINQHGAFYTLREAARHMVERANRGDPGGSLVICGSLAIFAGSPGMAHYSAAKGALNSMAKSMAVDLGKYQIRINVIAPGFIATEGTQEHPDMFKMIDAMVKKRTTLGRSGVPAELEGIAVYFASDASRYHTGDTVTIDGGQMANLF